jgi:hypothetical protein
MFVSAYTVTAYATRLFPSNSFVAALEKKRNSILQAKMHFLGKDAAISRTAA